MLNCIFRSTVSLSTLLRSSFISIKYNMVFINTITGATSKNKMRRTEDSIGFVEVPEERYFGPQTERSRRNFQVGLPRDKIPFPLIYSLAVIKEAAAKVNCTNGHISTDNCVAIVKACREIYNHELDDEFPLSVWQTGSGTQTNMNVNEVIANRASEIISGSRCETLSVHPNDDVNYGQSSNDIFPTAMNICIAIETAQKVLPNLKSLRNALEEKANSFMHIVKIGRTHLQDAVPMTVGQEIGAFVSQLDQSISSIQNQLEKVCELAVGGTAVGTGLNCTKGFDSTLCAEVNRLLKEHWLKASFPSSTELRFHPASNKFAALAGHDALLQLSGSFNCVATVLFKLATDFALLSSGPNCGFGELHLPPNEPGSSIMPGKINPTQCESLSMVSLQLMGNHFTVSMAAAHGQMQLNVYKPLIALNMLHSCQLLADSTYSFTEHCVRGLLVNQEQLERNVQHSLMLVTALVPHIGYDKAAKVVNYARLNNLSLREAAVTSGAVTEEEFNRLVKPKEMAFPFEKNQG